jgi:hypothetical protein
MQWTRNNNNSKMPLRIDDKPQVFDFCIRDIANSKLFILRSKERNEWAIIKNTASVAERVLSINRYITVARPKTLKAAKITYLMIGDSK